MAEDVSIIPGLERIARLASHLTPYSRPTCHIAGTNGKGSVAAITSSVLTASGYSVGRFNSPHLIDINDCIVINGNPISPESYATTREEVEATNRQHEIGATNFEILTMTALLALERASVDIVVLEVGMGGRLDATNIIPDSSVLVSALTAVDLDHQAFLGSTVEAIAREKASIVRRGKCFVLGPQKHPQVQAEVEKIVTNVCAQFICAAPAQKRPWDVAIDGERPIPSRLLSLPTQPIKLQMPCFSHSISTLLPLYGEYQLDNVGVAASILSALAISHHSHPLDFTRRITPESVAVGIRSTSWPGRSSLYTFSFQSSSRSMTALVDGAHNPASSATLAVCITDLLNNLPPEIKTISLSYVLALSHSPPKTALETLTPLFHTKALKVDIINTNVALVSFSPPDGMPWVKAVSEVDMKVAVEKLAPEAIIWSCNEQGSAIKVLAKALEWVCEVSGNAYDTKADLVIIAGSLYLVADFYRLLRARDMIIEL